MEANPLDTIDHRFCGLPQDMGFDLSRPTPIHFIGIGGISMSGIAEFLHYKGFTVTGSDSNKSDNSLRLQALGLTIHYGQRESHIPDGTDLVVFTAAIKPDNVEYADATARGLRLIERSGIMGMVMSAFSDAVSVSGTHGKTTTASMLACILLAAGKDPTINVGGIIEDIGSNTRIGHTGYFVAEACEYRDSFLKFSQRYGIITNIESDHLDYFRDLDAIRQSFRTFAEHLPSDGALVIYSGIEDMSELTHGLGCKVVPYYYDEHAASCADCKSDGYTAYNARFDAFGCAAFDVAAGGKQLCHIGLSIPGKHNILNATAALATATEIGIEPAYIVQALQSFKGARRRFEKKGEICGITVIDDYAHHPTEIRAALDTAARYPHGHLWVVFQPHTYTRTKSLLKEFATELSAAEHVILADIYAAREHDPGDISSRDLCSAVNIVGGDATYFPSFAEIVDHLLIHLAAGDMLLTMGAGEAYMIGDALLGTG